VTQFAWEKSIQDTFLQVPELVKAMNWFYSGVNIGKPYHERFSNPVAAVPSLHAGWAMALGVGLVLYARNFLLRAVGVLYPSAVMLTIVVTGNHFIFDALVGALVMAVGFAATAPFRVGARELAYARSQ
jgi:membrane-associated phospholipid phosphatase